MGRKPIAWLAAALVVLSACGKSRRAAEAAGSGGNAGAATGGAGTATGGTDTATGGTGPATGGISSGGSAGISSSACVVVRRLGCCAEPFAVTNQHLAADECLLPFDVNVTDGGIDEERCEATRPANCPPEPCQQEAPVSRAAAPDERSECRFVDECSDDSDCTFATQCCACCACNEPMPKSRVRDETCVVAAEDPDEPEPSPSICVRCPISLCQGCRHERTLSCSPTPGGLRRCQWGPPLPEDACSVERPCAGPLSGADCVAPDVTPCGGPPPPPDECADDSDCADAGETSICKPSGHCGMRRCEPGCASDAECSVGEICGANHHCDPKPCSDAGSCGPNFECGDSGLCVRSVCAYTTNCEGYCVNHLCYDAPGVCLFPLP